MRALALLIASGCTAGLADLEVDAVPEEQEKLGAAHGVEHEQLEYEMKVAGIVIGRFQIAVGARGVVDGRPAVIVRSRASLAGASTLIAQVDWELTTTIDIDSGFAIAAREDYVGDTIVGSYEKHADETWRIEDRHHNAHSAAGVLRGWRSAPGASDAVTLDVVDLTLPVTIADAERTTIGTAFGSRPTAWYAGVIAGKRAFSIWVSDDDARVPLRLLAESRVGAIEVDLVRYEVPRDH